MSCSIHDETTHPVDATGLPEGHDETTERVDTTGLPDGAEEKTRLLKNDSFDGEMSEVGDVGEEETRLLEGGASRAQASFVEDAEKENQQKKEGEEESTALEKEWLDSEAVWPQYCGEKRRRFWWVLPVVGLFVILLFVAWARRGDRAIDLWTWLWLGFFLVAGVGVGGGIFFSCSGWLLRRNKGELETWWGVFVPFVRKKRSLEGFARVLLTTEQRARPGACEVALESKSVPLEQDETRVVDPKDLDKEERDFPEDEVRLSPRAMILDYSAALRGAKKIASFLRWPLVDASTGGRVVREVESLEMPLVKRWKKEKKETKSLSPPSERQMVFKRAGDSIVMGRKGGPQGTTVWDVVFSSKTLIVGGKSFDVAQIEDLRVDESPYVHSDETRDPKILSGIHVFGPRRSVVFCKKLTREETFFVFTVLKAVFLGASPQKVLKGVSKRR